MDIEWIVDEFPHDRTISVVGVDRDSGNSRACRVKISAFHDKLSARMAGMAQVDAWLRGRHADSC